MRYINRYFLIAMIGVMAACAPAPTSMATTVPTVTATTPTESPTDSPTMESVSALQAGQFSFTFYHEGLEQVVLVNGGPERGKPASDPLELWGWDGSQWLPLAADADGPTWRNWAAIAYDSTRDVLVVHGGLQGASRRFPETWEWDGSTWTEFTGEGPGAREGALMVYDSAREKTVMFGGAVGMDIRGDTWEWANGSWTQVSETGPAARFPGGMVYDLAHQEVLLYSGHFAAATGEFIEFDDLWAWDGTEWRQLPAQGETPGHRTHTSLVFDPDTERVFLFGGGSDVFIGDIWSWDGQQWTEIPTSGMPGRSGSSVAYDMPRDRFVLFGGIDRPARPALSDTWEWDRAQWNCVSNCS